MLTHKWSCWRLGRGRSWCGWPCDPAGPGSVVSVSRWSCLYRWQPVYGRDSFSKIILYTAMKVQTAGNQLNFSVLPGVLDKCSLHGFPRSWKWPPPENSRKTSLDHHTDAFLVYIIFKGKWCLLTTGVLFSWFWPSFLLITIILFSPNNCWDLWSQHHCLKEVRWGKKHELSDNRSC